MNDSIRPRPAGISIGNGPLYDLLPDAPWLDGTGAPILDVDESDLEDATVEICGRCYGPLYLYTDEDGSETYCPECTVCRLPVDDETSF